MKEIPVDGYIRVSRVGGREGDRFISPELQRESIERVAARDGLKVVHWHEELDASGGDDTRPLWNEAIKRVEKGQTRGIVCWNLSRFSRSMKDALNAIERIEGAGGKLYSEEGTSSKLDRNLRLLIAEDERDRAKANFKAAVSNAIDRGIYIAAKIPFGYVRDPKTRKLVPDPQTSPVVVELFERRAKGMSWAELSRWVESVYGRPFARETLRGMIGNPAYLGHARQGEMVNEKAHKPLVSRLQWDRAHQAKGEKPIHTGESKDILLRGIVSCGTCGNKMIIGKTQGARLKDGTREKHPAYYCRNLTCENRAYIRGDLADAYVVDSIMSLLTSADATVTQYRSDPQALDQARKELEEAEYALDQFKANKRAIVTLGVDAWNDLLEEYVTVRDVAQTQIDLLRGDPDLPELESIPAQWAEWTTESRREFLKKIVRSCVVAPANRQKVALEDRLDFEVSLLGMNATLHSSALPDGWEILIDGEPV